MSRFDGGLLRARRQQLGLTVEELCSLSKVSYATVMQLESGAQRPSIGTLEKLCRALGCKPGVLFSGEEGDDADVRPTDLGEATDRAIAEMLASAPPMTERQAKRISAILFSGSD